MKKLINLPERVVVEAMEGMAAAHPDLLKAHYEPNFITRADAPVKGKVALISGGGSGHEPLHAGFVGKGMLDAACPGRRFTSPTPDQAQAAAAAVAGERGALLIVKNYTGDVMNFDLAAEMIREGGIPVESVVIDDDVAVKDSTWTAGRRGVGGTVLAEKICGAAAEAGQSLEQVRDLCKRVNSNVRSMGMALTSCTVPHVGRPTFDLPEDEMEFGVGIHGEPGRERMKLRPADEIVERLMEPILGDLPFKAGDEALLFVNGLGGTPLIELYIVYRKAAEIAAKAGVKIVRNLVGPYITSLEMAGASITLLKLDAEMTKLWDAPVLTRRSGKAFEALTAFRASGNDSPSPPKDSSNGSRNYSAIVEAWLGECDRTFQRHKDELTALDAAIGDADHGVNMARGFSAVPAKLDALPKKDIESLLRATGMTLLSQVGGASGPLYGKFFLQAAQSARGKTELSLQELGACFDAGLAAIVTLGKAAVGDKTMVDALTPALAALHAKDGDSVATALDRAVAAARAAAEATIPLVARKGRASYLGERSAGHKDPGAASCALLLEALAKTVREAASA